MTTKPKSKWRVWIFAFIASVTMFVASLALTVRATSQGAERADGRVHTALEPVDAFCNMLDIRLNAWISQYHRARDPNGPAQTPEFAITDAQGGVGHGELVSAINLCISIRRFATDRHADIHMKAELVDQVTSTAIHMLEPGATYATIVKSLEALREIVAKVKTIPLDYALD